MSMNRDEVHRQDLFADMESIDVWQYSKHKNIWSLIITTIIIIPQALLLYYKTYIRWCTSAISTQHPLKSKYLHQQLIGSYICVDQNLPSTLNSDSTIS